MLEAIKMSLSVHALIGFVLYMACAGLLLALFAFVYSRTTPHKEFALIREGNLAAAISMGGAMVGFVLPMVSAIRNSEYLVDFIAWAVVAAIVQLVVFFITSIVLPGLSSKITEKDVAAGTFVALVSISVGLINAACMTPA